MSIISTSRRYDRCKIRIQFLTQRVERLTEKFHKIMQVYLDSGIMVTPNIAKDVRKHLGLVGLENQLLLEYKRFDILIKMVHNNFKSIDGERND